MKLTRTLVALGLFAVAFGYVEAAVVAYLRTIYVPIRHATFQPVPNDDLFPLLQVEHLQAAGPQYVCLLWTELGREPRLAATVDRHDRSGAADRPFGRSVTLLAGS
jgi:hypothetical protein